MAVTAAPRSRAPARGYGYDTGGASGTTTTTTTTNDGGGNDGDLWTSPF